MGQTLVDIAQKLKNTDKKVQLIYAFNGSGKTRLSRVFKEDVAPNKSEDYKILYYNAFTEDLFYWDNDLLEDKKRKLLIRPNRFTDMLLGFLKDQGLDGNVIKNFQHYTSAKLTPRFNETYIAKDENNNDVIIKAYSEIEFSIEGGNLEKIDKIKISKSEESNFIWCIFYSLLEQVVEQLKILETVDRSTDKFNDLKYVFIDDPVSSLDDNHLIELAVNLATLITNSKGLKFIVSTHSPLFYNVLYNELDIQAGYILNKLNDGTFELLEKKGDSNRSFSYHLFLKQTIQEAIDSKAIQKYHFILLRNLYEKTAQFLGYPRWSDLLPEDKKTYYNRVIQFTSHSTLSNEVIAEPTDPEKQIVRFLLEHLVNSKYWKEEQNATV
ncbi:MAG: AAA family ATPase [Ignavibacteria bacterium]|nr:AAA family ATPase [Ignavibacteria bacterium]